jgi:hypothetical protein
VYLKVNLCSKTALANQDLVVGVKIRLDRNITDNGRNEHEAFVRAVEAAKAAKVILCASNFFLYSCINLLYSKNIKSFYKIKYL